MFFDETDSRPSLREKAVTSVGIITGSNFDRSVNLPLMALLACSLGITAPPMEISLLNITGALVLLVTVRVLGLAEDLVPKAWLA